MVAVFGLAVGVASRPELALATDPTWDVRHLGDVHTPDDDEDYCAETSATTRSFTNMIANIDRALYIDAPDDQQWDATSWDSVRGGYRVWLLSRQTPCQSIPVAERGPIEIEYWLADNNTSRCGSVKCNMAMGSTQFTDEKGHLAYQFYYLYLYAPWVNNEEFPGYYRHQVNHESGHAVGMDDGDGTCPDSVMHSSAYGCGIDRTWPSAGDKSGLDARATN